MTRELISRATRINFREWLVGWTLREIDDLFEGHGFSAVSLPPDELPHGQRRSLVECFYAGIDWTVWDDVDRVLRVYEDVLFQMASDSEAQKLELIRLLKRDGFSVEDDHIISDAATAIGAMSGLKRLDSAGLALHVRRIERALPDDPDAAIGASKELIESTLKTVLEMMGCAYEPSDDIPQLLKAVQSTLELAPKDVASAKRGADVIKKTLSNLGSVAICIAELRNLYGTGHGKGASHRGLGPRHARLAVSASAALCMFLLETAEYRKATAKLAF